MFEYLKKSFQDIQDAYNGEYDWEDDDSVVRYYEQLPDEDACRRAYTDWYWDARSRYIDRLEATFWHFKDLGLFISLVFEAPGYDVESDELSIEAFDFDLGDICRDAYYNPYRYIELPYLPEQYDYNGDNEILVNHLETQIDLNRRMNDLIEQITDDIAAGDEIDEIPYIEKFLHLSESNFREYIDEQWEFIKTNLSDEYFVDMVPESEIMFYRDGTMTNCSYIIEPLE